MAKTKTKKGKGKKGKGKKKGKKVKEEEPLSEEELSKIKLIADLKDSRKQIELNYSALERLNEEGKPSRFPPLWLQPGVPVLAPRQGVLFPAKVMSKARQRDDEWVIRFDSDGGSRARRTSELILGGRQPLQW